MKKFLIFLTVCVAIAAVGFSVYYFTKDNEVIKLNYTTIPINKGATIEAKGLLSIENPSKYTTITYGSEDTGILEYNSENGLFVAKAGGKTNISIETKNNRYNKMTIEVVVRDGTEEYPYIVSNETDLRNIGKSSDFTLDMHYKIDTSTVSKEIVLTARWLPIGTNPETGDMADFNGIIDGNGHTVSNINVSKYSEDEIKAACKPVAVGGAAEGETIEPGFSDETFDYVITGASQAMRDYNALLDTKIKNAGFIYSLSASAVVQDLVLSGVNMVGEFDSVGGVAAKSAGKIISTEVRGKTIESTKAEAYVGGIVGRNEGNSAAGSMALIDRSAAIVGIKHITDQTVGGVAGYNSIGLVSESYFRGALTQVTGISKTFGGIIGENVGSANSIGTKFYYGNARDSFALIYIPSTETTFAQYDTNKIAGAVGKNIASTEKSNTLFGLHYALLFVGDSENPLNDILSFKDGIAWVKEVEGAQPDGETAGNGGFTKAMDMSIAGNYTSRSTRNGWNFSEVWEFDTSAELTYPILKKGAIGSNFESDPNTPPGGDDPVDPPVVNEDYRIETAQELYDKLTKHGEFNTESYGTDKVYVITADLNMGEVDADHDSANGISGWEVITVPFTGGLFGEVGLEKASAKLTGLNISKLVADTNVGIFAEVNGGVFSNLSIEDVNITGINDNEVKSNVGVLAGRAVNADVNLVEIHNVVVNIDGSTFGTIFGQAIGGEIKNCKISNIDGTIGTVKNNLFDFAGGVVGMNGDRPENKAGALINGVTVSDVKLVAYRFGGVAGYNYMQTISNADVSGMIMQQYKEGSTTIGDPDYFLGVIAQDPGPSLHDVFVGGIVGYNGGAAANIVNSSASSTIRLSTAMGQNNRELYIVAGGIVGKNERGKIQDVYVYSTEIKTYNSYDARLGGIVGDHHGDVLNALVNNDVNIESSTTYQAAGHRSLVGGIAGITWGDSVNSSLIKNAGVYAETISGFYAGGLVGMSYGNIENSYVGNTDKLTTVKGFYTGGIAAAIIGNYRISGDTVLARYGGQVQSVYACVTLVAELSKTDAAGNATVGEDDGVIFKNGIIWENIRLLNKGIAAGIAPFILGEARVSEGYAVASFASGDNAGYRFQTTFSQCAGDLATRRYWTAGTMSGVIYVNEQSVTFEVPPNSTEPGIKKTPAQLKTEEFTSFGWTADNWQAGETGKYPELKGLNEILKNIAKPAGSNPVVV